MAAPHPVHLEVIGELLAIRWSDGAEDFLPMEKLRAASPSAENIGERDLTGTVMGGSDRTTFPGVSVVGWEPVGGYALLFTFSDGHRTGIYPFAFLRELGKTIGA